MQSNVIQEAGPSGSSPRRCVLIAGASGLIGHALVPLLHTQGHSVRRLMRGAPVVDTGEIRWDPARGELDPVALEGVDAIVNLSGENVGRRWTVARRTAILRSRVDATRTLVTAIQKMQRKPEVFVSASAVGFYGERGDEEITEVDSIGHGFLPEVCLAWETHAEGAARAGLRVALTRFGVVLTPKGGALAKLLPLFRIGLGGRVGSGRQWMSWIGIEDAVGAIYHAIMEPRCSGVLNVVSPQPATNADFTATLARVLRRPAFCPVPAAMLRLVFGQMADETLLQSTRVLPAALLAAGFEFRHPTLETALRAMLGR